MPVFLPECYRYYSVVSPYNVLPQTVMPGTVASAKSTAIANAKACYSLAVAGIKKAQLTRPATSPWAWYEMGYPNNYACWSMVSGNPASDPRLGAWFLYGGDKPPVWRASEPMDPYTGLPHPIGGQVAAEGAVVCN